MSFKYLKEFTALSEDIPGSGFFHEAESYSDPGKFIDEFNSLYEQILKMKKVMKHPKWIEWMKMTERNSDAVVEDSARVAIQAITDLEDSLKKIEDEFDRLTSGESIPEPEDEPKSKGKKK